MSYERTPGYLGSAEHVRRIQDEIARLATALETLGEAEQDRKVASKGNGLNAGEIRALIRARRLRSTFFPGDLFSDPAWDMMLDLMAARLLDQRVSVSSLCIAAGVPATTALRWIRALTDRGIFIRKVDREDPRRAYIELSDEAAESMKNYLESVRQLDPVGG